jgi:hypothetical protein
MRHAAQQFIKLSPNLPADIFAMSIPSNDSLEEAYSQLLPFTSSSKP